MTGPARRWFSVCLVAVLLGVLGAVPARSAALFEEDFMSNGGYLRQYVSMNLQDIPETFDDDRYNLNMVRTQVLLETDMELTGWASIHSRLRAAREHETEYLRQLSNPSGADGTPGTADDNLSPFATAPVVIGRNGAAEADFYAEFLGENDLEIRELYLDLNLTRSTRLRLGKQMPSWGKGSFQRALDLVTGFDNSWAPFITSEEERRKSLLMAVLNMDMPALGGSVEVFYQPGFDDAEDIGTTDPSFGGRYTANGIRGINTQTLLTVPPVPLVGLPQPTTIQVTAPFNENHPSADIEDEKFGIRFQGLAFSNRVEYSLAYLRTHQKSSASHTVLTPYEQNTITTADPRCTDPAFGSNAGDSIYKVAAGTTNCLPSGRRRESINPLIDVVGGSFNYYSPLLDLVIRGEGAFIKDKLFDRVTGNVGLRTSLLLLDPTGQLLTVFSDSIEKDEYRLMLGFDRTAYFVRYLGADRPGLLTVEFFDFIIDDFRDSEGIIDTSHARGIDEHTVEGVLNLRWSYANGYVAPEFQVPIDLSYGGNYTLIPGFTISPTTNWRINVKGVFVMEDRDDGTSATDYGFNGDADRITTQVTYQF